MENLCSGKINPKKLSCLTVEEIKSIGTSSSKARSIKTLADAVLSNELDLKSLAEKDDNEVIKSLTKLHEIGLWTAKMFLIFALDRQDVLPFEDIAFCRVIAGCIIPITELNRLYKINVKNGNHTVQLQLDICTER